MATPGSETPSQETGAGELRVLLVEDSIADAELAIWRLRQGGYACTYQRVVTETEMRAALRAGLPDLILSDFSLPEFDGMSALAIARAEAPAVPFISFSPARSAKSAPLRP